MLSDHERRSLEIIADELAATVDTFKGELPTNQFVRLMRVSQCVGRLRHMIETSRPPTEYVVLPIPPDEQTARLAAAWEAPDAALATIDQEVS